jgi:hypothetical protein
MMLLLESDFLPSEVIVGEARGRRGSDSEHVHPRR